MEPGTDIRASTPVFVGYAHGALDYDSHAT
jgi:hypothetical protein